MTINNNLLDTVATPVQLHLLLQNPHQVNHKRVEVLHAQALAALLEGNPVHLHSLIIRVLKSQGKINKLIRRSIDHGQGDEV